MSPSDVALLLVLGAAEEEATPFEDICSTARLIAPEDWQPTSEVMAAAAERALGDGLVVRAGEAVDGRTPLATTDLGRREIARLLRKPIPSGSGGFMRTCMSAKLCFLHLLPPPERGVEAVALAAHYREAIHFVERLQRLPRALAGSAVNDLGVERVRLDSEPAWLQGMRAWPSLPRAAE